MIKKGADFQGIQSNVTDSRVLNLKELSTPMQIPPGGRFSM